MPNLKEIWSYIENDKLLKGTAILIIGMVILFIIVLFVKFFFVNPPKSTSKYPQASNDSTETKNGTSKAEENLISNENKPNGKMPNFKKGKVKFEVPETNDAKENNDNKKGKKMDESKKVIENNTANNYGTINGINAGKVEIRVEKKEDLDEVNIDFESNYIAEYSANNLFKCHPKAGKWVKPFIVILYEEKDRIVNFGSSEPMIRSVSEGDVTIGDVKLYGNYCGQYGAAAIPATSSVFYTTTFNKKPSIILFGDFERLAYIYDCANGTTRLLK